MEGNEVYEIPFLIKVGFIAALGAGLFLLLVMVGLVIMGG